MKPDRRNRNQKKMCFVAGKVKKDEACNSTKIVGVGAREVFCFVLVFD